MGREVKRVPMNFEAPLNKVWRGYINPYGKYSHKCEVCGGCGQTPEAKFISDTFYHHCAEERFRNWVGHTLAGTPTAERLRRMGWDETIIGNIEMARKFGFKILASWRDKLEEGDIKALVREGRLNDWTHTWDKEKGWTKKKKFKLPTNDEVAAWDANGMGHDSINQWILSKRRFKKFKIKVDCPACNGQGSTWEDPKYEKLYDDWKDEEPPEGEGWQMWETTSEGSPISPVFATPEKLARYLADTNASSFGDMGASYDQWLSMIKAGWAPSAMASAETGLVSGVAAVALHAEEKDDA